MSATRIIVCVKPVPDPKHWDKVSVDPLTQTLRREGIPTVINPLDKHALEAALCIRSERGGEVVLLSMAPSFAVVTLREGLAMGADRAVLLSDPAFAGSDALATARILAAGCRWIGEFHLVLLGNLSIDGSTAQVCSQLGEFLNLPSVMHVIGIEWKARKEMVVTQKIERGYTKLMAKSPIVISVRKEINKPRYIPFAGILAAESKQIEILTNKELQINPSFLGIEGSPTKMAGIEVRRFERAKERLEGSIEEVVEKMVEKIHQYGVI